MKSLIRISAAALAATLAPTLITVGCFGLMAIGSDRAVDILALVFIVALVISFAHTVVLGLPAMLCLNKLGRLNARSVIAIGFVEGCVPTLMFYLWIGERMRWTEYMGLVFSLGALGAAAGIAFWSIWSSRCSVLSDAGANRNGNSVHG